MEHDLRRSVPKLRRGTFDKKSSRGLSRFSGKFSSRWALGPSSRSFHVEKDPTQLRLLICTANLGNAEPSEKCMEAWIPEKGNMDAVVNESQFDIGFDDSYMNRKSERKEGKKRYGHFDIIVIGMQEATFQGQLPLFEDNSASSSFMRNFTRNAAQQVRIEDQIQNKELEKVEERKEKVLEEKETKLNEEKAALEKNEPTNEINTLNKDDKEENHTVLKESLDTSTLMEKANSENHVLNHDLDAAKNETESKESTDLELPGSHSYTSPQKIERAKTFELYDNLGQSLSRKSIRFKEDTKQGSFQNVMEQHSMNSKPRKSAFSSIISAFSIGALSSDNQNLKKSHDTPDIIVKCTKQYDKRTKTSSTQETKYECEKPKRKSIPKIMDDFRLLYRSTLLSENFMSRKGGKLVCNTKNAGKDSKVLHRLISNRCPNHTFVVQYLHGGIRLMVLVKKKLVKELSKVKCKAVSTGIGSVLRNKGGIVATMTIRKTRLAFISAHLAAHEGRNYYKQRNQNVATILHSGTHGKYDASLANHHCFFFGDLNYRLNFPPTYEDKDTIVEKVVDLVNKREWNDLNEIDELRIGLKENDMMVGFKTPLCLFPPTFKVQRESGYNYLSQRTPSYTDRILWKSSEGLESNVRPIVYEPIENYICSDHKPIRSAFFLNTSTSQSSFVRRISMDLESFFSCFGFSCKARRKPSSRRSFASKSSFMGSFFGNIVQPYIDISEMRCYDIKSRSQNTFHLTFESDPPNLRSRGIRNASNNEISSTLKPSSESYKNSTMDHICWNEEEIRFEIKDEEELIGAVLYVNLMANKNSPFGTTVLNLENLCKFYSTNERNEFFVDEPLLKNGVIQGRVQFNLQVFRPELSEILGASLSNHL